MRFLCGSAGLLLWMMCASVHPQAVDDDAAWLERSRRLLEQAVLDGPPPWLRVVSDEQSEKKAEEIAAAAIEHTRGSVSTHPSSERILIFASFSVPRPTLAHLLEEATRPNVALVLRGVPAGSSVPETIRRLRALLKDATRTPQVMLDPTLFRRFDIERVPTLVLQRSGGEPPIRVQGAVTVDWLRRMASHAGEGAQHLGRRAEDYEIAEVDLIEEMQQRLTRIDWSARRQVAASAFWERQRAAFIELPEAKESRQFVVDPSVRVTKDLSDAEGHRLIAAGETFNPLQFVPLTKTIIVFSGTSERQIRTAVKLARSARQSGKGVILLTSAVEAQRGWVGWGELEKAFEAAVYLLPQALVDRFQLERLPATVVSRGRDLIVTEVPVAEDP